VTPGFVARHPVWCAIRGASMLGFYALSGAGLVREREHLWVLPAYIRRGVGARLVDHAVATLSADGARVLRIASDPNAEGFYLTMGAGRVGEVASTPRGRALPALGSRSPRGRRIRFEALTERRIARRWRCG